MDKKILSTVMAAALAAPMAVMADTTVFGLLSTSIDAVDVQGGTDDINMNSTTSSIGFKGKEDLGNGLKAMFKIDFQYDTTERNRASGGTPGGSVNSITDRDQWVGLGADWGSIKFGTISTGYKSTGAMIDPLYRTSAQARGLGLQSALHEGAGEDGQGRMTNHVRYDTPNMNGFKGVIDYSFDSKDATDSNDAYAFTGIYKNGPVLGFASYITSNNGGDDYAWKIGGSYAVSDEFKVFGQYEGDGGLISQAEKAGTAKLTAQNATGDGLDIWHLGGAYSTGNNTLYFAYGQGDDSTYSGTANSSDYSTWTLAAVHSFSKRTNVYGGFNRRSCDGNSGTTCSAVGSISGLGANGGDIDVFTLGMTHKF